MIVSQRLKIEPWSENQAAEFFELTQDDGLNLFPIKIYRQVSVESAKLWIRETVAQNQETSLGKWAVRERQSGELIGIGGLTPWTLGDENLVDITYRLRQSAWGKGFGLELAEALIRYGFNDLKLPQITATITPDNTASKKIAEKLGMKFDQKILLLNVSTDLYRLHKPN